MAPTPEFWSRAVSHWSSFKTDAGAHFDKHLKINSSEIAPQVTWGTNPQHVGPITGCVPDPKAEGDADKRKSLTRALEYMGLEPGQLLSEVKIDKVFIGSCTNGRIEDLREVAEIVKGHKVATGVQALVVPGSGLVKAQAESEGISQILEKAGFEWRDPGCSMCLAMNSDRLLPAERCASTSNRNFEGRQGKGGRTHLMSPGMAAAAAIRGKLTDVRKFKRGYHTSREQKKSQENPFQFEHVNGKCVPLEMINVDTDMIIPKQHLKTIKRVGLGKFAFEEIRYNSDGTENPNFVLNFPKYRGAKILVAGDNFGCGSSREHAPWALLDLGFRCIISTGFADIFFNNCFKNGILPIVLPKEQWLTVLSDAKSEIPELEVDLRRNVIVRRNGSEIGFSVDIFRRECLLNGVDDIGLTLQKEKLIGEFEKRQMEILPWL